MRVDGGVAGEGRVAGLPNFHSWGISAPCHFNEYQLRLDVQRFLWPVYYITRVLYFASWGVISLYAERCELGVSRC